MRTRINSASQNVLSRLIFFTEVKMWTDV